VPFAAALAFAYAKPPAHFKNAATPTSAMSTSTSPLSLKDEGNALLQSSPTAAIEKWSLAISCDACPDDIKIACYSNSALAHIQLRAWKDAIRCASAAIALSPPAHVKSLFRRAQAYRTLGSLGRAAADLKSIIKVDKTNSAARAELDAVNAARLRPSVHADFMVRLLQCDGTDDEGNESGVEAALCSCFQLSCKGFCWEAVEAFRSLQPAADGENEDLGVSRRACEAWLLLNTMQFDAAETVATQLVEKLAAPGPPNSATRAGQAVVRADALMLLAWTLAGAGHFDAALDRCDEGMQVSAAAGVCASTNQQHISHHDAAPSRAVRP
jgi:tetratricopeptide (TPR) repeat protein